MRKNVLVALSALSLSLAACSSDSELKPYGDELFPNEQPNVTAVDQSVPSAFNGGTLCRGSGVFLVEVTT